MTRHEEQGGTGGPVGRRSRGLRIADLTLATALVLGAPGAAWAYWHLNHDVTGVDIDSALGDDRAARPLIDPAATASAATSPLPAGALTILVLGSDSRSGRANRALGGGDSSGARSDTATSTRDVRRPPSSASRATPSSPARPARSPPAARRRWRTAPCSTARTPWAGRCAR